MRRPVVDKKTCVGSGTCEVVCPEVLELDAERRSGVKAGVNYELYKEKIEDAIAMCPVAAIKWQEEDAPSTEPAPPA